MGKIAVIGDVSDHGGVLIDAGGNTAVLVNGLAVAVNGALHTCPIRGHGTTPVAAITTKTFIDGKLVVTKGAMAGCGAVIQPVDRGVNVE